MKKNKGISLLEVIISISIIIIGLTAFFTSVVFSLKISTLVKQTTIADSLLQEAAEAVRAVRNDSDWEDGLGFLSTGESNPYYPELIEGPPFFWSLTSGTETINGFLRKIIFEKVSRDSITGNIEEIYNPLNDDPNTRKIIITVSWENKEEKIITYITNWK